MKDTWIGDYQNAVGQVASFGHCRQSRVGQVKELNVVTINSDPLGWLKLLGRGGSTDFARLEQLCYVSGRNAAVLGRLLPNYARLCRWEGHEADPWPDSYGPRMKTGLRRVVCELAERPDSRRAVVNIHQGHDTELLSQYPERPVPCTVALQFFTTPGEDRPELTCHAMMRSCDVWLGLYYDLPAFSFINTCVALALGVPAGRTFLTATSLHLYEQDWVGAGHFLRSKREVLAVVNPANVMKEVLSLHHSDEVRTVDQAAWRWSSITHWCGLQVEAWEESQP